MTASKKSRGKAHSRRINNWNIYNNGDYCRSVDNGYIDEETITYIIGFGVLVVGCLTTAIINL